MVDLYPQLLPMIRKSEIMEHLEGLKKEVRLETVNYDKYRPLMNWFRDHEFYLTQEQCNEINRLKEVYLIPNSRRGHLQYA